MIARKIVVAAALVHIAGVMPAGAQDVQNRTIEQYKCRDVMRESGANRDIAIAFLHGILLGRSGGSSFNLDALHRQTEKFVDSCLSNPDARAIDTMMAAKQ